MNELSSQFLFGGGLVSVSGGGWGGVSHNFLFMGRVEEQQSQFSRLEWVGKR